jgi:ankyrin repeat protein
MSTQETASDAVPEELKKKFIAAVKAGDTATVGDLLASSEALKVTIDAPWFDFDAPAVITASKAKNAALLDVLIAYGADINARSQWWAGGFGVLPCHDDDWAKHLVSRGASVDVFAAAGHDWLDEMRRMLDADPSLVNARGGDGQTPLHFARSPQTCALLLERGAELDARDVDHGSTPAQYAIQKPEKLRFLVDRGAQVDPFIAAALGDIPMLEAMIQADADTLNATVLTGSHNPLKAPGEHIYAYLIGNSAPLLHAAALFGHPLMLEYLIERGADVNAGGAYDDSTALHGAAWRNKVDAIRVLLDHGADIDRRSGELHKNTPAAWAIVAGSVEALELLLQRGAPIHPWFQSDLEKGSRGEFNWSGAKPESWPRMAELVAAYPHPPQAAAPE